MTQYIITEVDGSEPETAAEIIRFNSMVPETIFPKLKPHHLTDGYWWIVHYGDEPVAFAGMTAFEPFQKYGIGYFKRCLVVPDHRGRGAGLQLRLMVTRETKARRLGWTMLVSDCAESNIHSARNFRLAQFDQCFPEQLWAETNGPSLYWVKAL